MDESSAVSASSPLPSPSGSTPTSTAATASLPTGTGANSTNASGASTSAGPSTSATVTGVKRGKQSIRAGDQKRKKLVPRCTSPSHFLIEDPNSTALHSNATTTVGSAIPSNQPTTPIPSALSADPNAPAASKLSDANARIDSYLHSIGTMYYRNQMTLGKDTNGPAEVWVSSDYDKLEYPTLDLLLSPLRKPNVLDNWCPREIALFEAGICAVGKDFHAIANLITTKTCKECVDFYYVWKKSSHYAMWKNFGKPSKKPHSNKEEQWKAIKEQMKAGTTQTNTSTSSSINKETNGTQQSSTAGTNGIKKEP